MNSPWDSYLRLLAFASVMMAGLALILLKRRDLVGKLLLVFLLLCLAFITVNWKLGLDLGQYDARLYQSLASGLSRNLTTDWLVDLKDLFVPYWAYTLPLGLIYTVFGPSPLVGYLFNTIMGIGVILNLHRLARLCFSRRVADGTAVIMVLYPYGWVLSGTLNRDMMIAFFLTLLFRLLAEMTKQPAGSGNGLKGALALGCMAYLTLLRPPLLLLCGLVGLAYLLIGKCRTLPRKPLLLPLKVGLLLTLLTAGGTILYQSSALTQFRLAAQAAQFTDIDNLNVRLQNSEDASSAYLEGVRYASYQDILWVMPLSTFYFMYSPLPWQVISAKQALGLVDSLFLMVITYFFLWGFKDLHRSNRKFSLTLAAFLIVGFCTSGLLQANVGAAMRHRTMFFFLMFPVAVQGFLHWRQRRRSVVLVRRPVTGREVA